jgi:enoyl-CoA hydratase/carnithine racemase
MDLLLTGRVIDGTEAERIGFLARLWPRSNYEAELQTFLEDLARGPTRTYAAWKLTVNRAVLQELDSYTDYERALTDVIRQTDDHAEGRLSFREKRPPEYLGR